MPAPFFFSVVKKYSLEGQRGKGAALCLPGKFIVAIAQIKRIRQCVECLRLSETKNKISGFSSYLYLRCQYVLPGFFSWILDAVLVEKKIFKTAFNNLKISYCFDSSFFFF